MAGTLKLTDIAHSSGAGTITVDSLATLSLSTGKLLVGGTAIESGDVSVNTITAASTDLGTAPEVAMWTGKTKAIFMVDASGGARTVQLPAASATGRSTVSIVISCKATSAVPATVSPNLVTINNSSGSEVFTLYAVGDYVEFISDGTNDLRTGNEHISAKGFIFRTANESIGAGATEVMFQAAEFTVKNDWGAWWNSTNFAAEIPYACRILVECAAFTQNAAGQLIFPSIKRFYSSRAANEYIWRRDNRTAAPTNGGDSMFIYDFAAGDEIEYSVVNWDGGAQTLSGDATDGWYQGAYAKWTVLRRY